MSCEQNDDKVIINFNGNELTYDRSVQWLNEIIRNQMELRWHIK
jgi:hypothetical protein